MFKVYTVSFGCDPEFFFKNDKGIVGAEKVFPKDGLTVGINNSKFIIDGVQAELNPAPSTCRQLLANEISRCFAGLDEVMKTKGVVADFSQTVEVDKENFDNLSDDSKKFGCSASKNIYKSPSKSKIKVDPMVYRKRSAGGHIHLGRTSDITSEVLDNPKKIVPILDILLGNTCVLIDRDIGNIERRKNYGRAGEHRTPKHGLEYRTLSNFWLKNYKLMSFVFGMARFAVAVVVNKKDKEFLKAVKMKDIEKAINKNDFKLAYENFLKIEPIISEIAEEVERFGYSVPLTVSTMQYFKHFINKGMDYWFKETPLEHWNKHTKTLNLTDGWETFLATTVKQDFEQENK